MQNLDQLDLMFVVWAFLYQIVLIIHFSIRKRYFESYTMKYGWIVYALAIPGLFISVFLFVGGKSRSFWLGGLLLLVFSIYGYYIDYIKKIQWRKPLNKSIMFPYVFWYLATIMFYWWPLALISKPLWYVYAVLFVAATYLNVKSH
jgi:hypothetical protein